MMEAVLSNADHPEYGVATIPLPIPRNQYDHCVALLEALEIGDASEADCRLDSLDSALPVLNRLVCTKVNLDELDYLAKRLDSFTVGEFSQFQAMAEKLNLTSMKDLINLTFCCQQATVITDFTNLKEVGRDHYMNIHGGCASMEELEQLDGVETAVLLIEDNEGTNIERVQPPNYMTNIQGVLDAYSSALATVQSPFLDWLQTVDIPPLTRIWERWDTERRLEEERYRELQKLHLQVMYQARWFPYASTLAGDMLFDEINEIIASSKIGATVSKRCEKRIDTAILSHYNKAEIKRIKKKWNDSEIEPYFKKALGQTLDAYLRKEYALAIPFLGTMWEGIIKSKVGKNEKKFKEKCKDLVDENGYDEVFSDFFNNLIFGQCYSVNDVVDGIPNRNGVAHSWYIKYPSQKAALNAILLTDFVLSLKPKNEAEDIEKE